jgi:hypothetical protein
VAFLVPYVYDYTIKICRKRAEVVQNHDNLNVRNVGKNEAKNRKFKRLRLGAGQAYVVQAYELPQQTKTLGIMCSKMPGLIGLECELCKYTFIIYKKQRHRLST